MKKIPKLSYILFFTNLIIFIIMSIFIYWYQLYIASLFDSQYKLDVKISELESDLRNRGIIQGEINTDAKPYSLEQMEEFQKYSNDQQPAEE